MENTELLKTFKVSVKNNVVRVDFFDNITDRKENVIHTTLICEQITEVLSNNPKKKFNLLVDISKIPQDLVLPSRSRKAYAEIAKHNSVDKIAVVGKGLIIKTIINFIIDVAGKREQFKWFEDIKEAQAWLK